MKSPQSDREESVQCTQPAEKPPCIQSSKKQLCSGQRPSCDHGTETLHSQQHLFFWKRVSTLRRSCAAVANPDRPNVSSTHTRVSSGVQSWQIRGTRVHRDLTRGMCLTAVKHTPSCHRRGIRSAEMRVCRFRGQTRNGMLLNAREPSSRHGLYQVCPIHARSDLADTDVAAKCSELYQTYRWSL